MRRKLLDAVRRQAASADPLVAQRRAAQRRGHIASASDGTDADDAGVGSRSSERFGVRVVAAGAGDDGTAVSSTGRDATARSAEALADVEAVIAWLLANDFLSDQRFVEGRAHARESGQGYARIRRELAEHGLDLPEAAAADLRQSEFDRAFALCRRRFGDVPAASPSEDARRYRFLMRRGFAGDVVVRVMRDAKRPT